MQNVRKYMYSVTDVFHFMGVNQIMICSVTKIKMLNRKRKADFKYFIDDL